jgi:magnesium-transporting ATPase (P-type)
VTIDKIEWYKRSIDDIFSALTSGSSGLSDIEAKNRLERYGFNELIFKKRSALIMLLNQFRDPLVYVLLVTSLITAILKEWPETIVILFCVIINAIIGFIQEGKAESSIDALKKMMVQGRREEGKKRKKGQVSTINKI